MRKANFFAAFMMATMLVAGCNDSNDAPETPAQVDDNGGSDISDSDSIVALSFDNRNDTVVQWWRQDFKVKVSIDDNLSDVKPLLDNAVISNACDYDAELFGQPDPWIDLGIAGNKPELDLEWVKMTLEKEDGALWLHVVVTELEEHSYEGRAIKVAIAVPCADSKVLTGEYSIEQCTQAVGGVIYFPKVYFYGMESPYICSGEAGEIYIDVSVNPKYAGYDLGEWSVAGSSNSWITFTKVQIDGRDVIKAEFEENRTGLARSATTGVSSGYNKHFGLGDYGYYGYVSYPEHFEVSQKSL